MPCIDISAPRGGAPTGAVARLGGLLLRLNLIGLVGVIFLTGCSGMAQRKAPEAPPVASSPPPAQPAAPVPALPPVVGLPLPAAPPAPPAASRFRTLGPPATPRSADELRLQMAWRLVQAHPGDSYTARAPDRLLAIPVLEIDLNADGSVRRIGVLRHPSTGDQATQLAIAAVRRAAPYGDVSRLPRPWRVVETFLFDDQLRFKPRTLD